jgi:hypothetical protein
MLCWSCLVFFSAFLSSLALPPSNSPSCFTLLGALSFVRPNGQGCGLTRLACTLHIRTLHECVCMRCFVHPPLLIPRPGCCIHSLLQFILCVLRLADAVMEPTYHTHARTRPNGTYNSPTIFLLHPLPLHTALIDVSGGFPRFTMLYQAPRGALPSPSPLKLALYSTRSLIPSPSSIPCDFMSSPAHSSIISCDALTVGFPTTIPCLSVSLALSRALLDRFPFYSKFAISSWSSHTRHVSLR